jgi:ketosteroid isomerase-like protein
MKKIAVMLFIFIVAVAFAGCSKETEESKIKKVITEIQAAGEEKEVKKIMAHISKTYNDPRGYNYEGIHGLLLGYFFRYPKISAYITNIEVSVEGESAKAMFEAVLTSSDKTGSIKDIIPQELGVWDFDVTLKKESGEWKVTSAQWEQAQVLQPEE